MQERQTYRFFVAGCAMSVAICVTDAAAPPAFGLVTAGHLISVITAARGGNPQHVWVVAIFAAAAVLVGHFLGISEPAAAGALAGRLALIVLLAVAAWLVTKPGTLGQSAAANHDEQGNGSESEALLNSIIENMPMGFVVKDKNHTNIRVNTTFYEWYGLTKENLIGRQSDEIGLAQTSTDGVTMHHQEQEVLDKGVSHGRLVERRFADGQLHTVRINKFPIYDQNGAIAQIGSVSTDLTEQIETQRALEQQQSVLQSIIDNVPVGLLIKDANHVVETANTTYMEWYGHEPDTMAGRRSDELEGFQTEEDAAAMYVQEREVLRNGVIMERTIERPFADGKVHTIQVTKFPIYDQEGKIVKVGSVTVDLTDQVEARHALETHEQLLASIVHDLPVGLVVKDREGRRVLVNQTNLHWYGRSIEDTIGKTYVDTFAPHYGEETLVSDQERHVMETGKTVSRETVRRFADGTMHHLLISKYPVRGQDGSITGTVSVSVDLTNQIAARRAQAESEQRFRDFAEVSADWVWEMDEHLRFSYFSERSRVITGFDPQKYIGLTRREIAADKGELDKWAVHLDDLDNHRPFRDFEYEITRADGSPLKIRISGKPIYDEDGRFMGYRGTGSDITEQREIQEARDAALISAERANRSKSEFLAAMSHELRTPLNAILGFSDILLHRRLGPDKEDRYSEYASDIHSSAQHLLALVNDLLDVSAIEAGKVSLEMEPVNVEDLLKDCANNVAKTAEVKRIGLSTEAPADLPPLFADRRAVKQIVLNLLSNAVKFTPEGGEVVLAATAENGGHTISISDNGDGIPEDKLEEIINPFTQVGENPYTAGEGWGLGLSITHSLVQLHKGQLAIDSKVGRGTTVRVTLPTGGTV